MYTLPERINIDALILLKKSHDTFEYMHGYQSVVFFACVRMLLVSCARAIAGEGVCILFACVCFCIEFTSLYTHTFTIIFIHE